MTGAYFICKQYSIFQSQARPYAHGRVLAFFIRMKNLKFEFTKNTYSKGFRNLLIYAGFNKDQCLSKELQVHHLDHDRDNNHFTNLVLMCKKRHGDYHKSCRCWYFKIGEYHEPHKISEYELEFLYYDSLQKWGNSYSDYVSREYEQLKEIFIPLAREIREMSEYQHSKIAKAILKLP